MRVGSVIGGGGMPWAHQHTSYTTKTYCFLPASAAATSILSYDNAQKGKN